MNNVTALHGSRQTKAWAIKFRASTSSGRLCSSLACRLASRAKSDRFVSGTKHARASCPCELAAFGTAETCSTRPRACAWCVALSFVHGDVRLNRAASLDKKRHNRKGFLPKENRLERASNGVLQGVFDEAVKALPRARRSFSHATVKIRRHSKCKRTGIGPLQVFPAFFAPILIVSDCIRECSSAHR